MNKNPLSPCACLREAASAKAGESDGVRGNKSYPPHPMHRGGYMTVLNLIWFRACPPPSRGRV